MTTICNEDGSHSGLYFGCDTGEFEIIYRLGDGCPMFYRDDEVYYRYSDGMHVFYVVEDEDGKHLFRFDKGPSLHCPCRPGSCSLS
jgi:hypothetical protein